MLFYRLKRRIFLKDILVHWLVHRLGFLPQLVRRNGWGWPGPCHNVLDILNHLRVLRAHVSDLLLQLLHAAVGLLELLT